MMTLPVTARRAKLISCLSCHLLSPASAESRPCPRCGAHLRSRKVNSLIRCWALIMASFILYLPANLLPITITTTFAHPPTAIRS